MKKYSILVILILLLIAFGAKVTPASLLFVGLIGMAKVSGPLLSIEARGKIAEALVFFPWKGRHLVRQWLKPANPKRDLQGYVRVALKLIGKAIARIQSISQGDTPDSYLYTKLTSLAPAAQPWNAYMAKQVLEDLKSAGSFKTGSFTDMSALYSTHSNVAAFSTDATALNLSDFAFDYGYVTSNDAGFQLYMAAYAAQKLQIAGFTTALADWVASDVNNLKSAFLSTTIS